MITFERGPVGDALLAVRIAEIHSSDATRGARRVHCELTARGVHTSRKRVARIMSARDMSGARERRKLNTPLVYAPRIMKRRSIPTHTDRVWAGDITQLATADGWLYVAVFLDMRSRFLVGWAVGERADAHLAIEALALGVNARKPAHGLLVHTDRGVQYSAGEFRAVLDARGFVASMSRRGNCHDNAAVESFFASMKRELGARALKTETLARMRSRVVQFLAGHYNHRRAHSTLGYRCPAAFEQLGASEQGTLLAQAAERAAKIASKRAAEHARKRELERASDSETD